MTQFKNFLDSLLPVAEELGDKSASIVVKADQPGLREEIGVDLHTKFTGGKVERTVTITVPG